MKRLPVLLALVSLSVFGEVKLTQGETSIKVDIDGQPFTELFYGPDTHKPYLHPIRAASGTVVTRSYPMAEVEGERKDHPHHQGLWFNHGNVNGVDFWSSSGARQRENSGRIALNRIVRVTSGEKGGSLVAMFDWKDAKGKVLATERRKMAFRAQRRTRVIDCEFTLRAVGDKVKFGDTKEGSFAIRIAAPLNESHSGKLVNAHGKSTEKEVWGKPSPWVDYSGEINGERLGIAIFDHPGNPKHPTYWHVRGYGLFAANIFGEHDFYRDEARDGGLTLEPGESWTFRYRVIIHPGDAASARLDRLYERYAKQ